MQAVTAVVQILRKASELVTLLQPLYNVGDGVGDLALDVDNLRYVNSALQGSDTFMRFVLYHDFFQWNLLVLIL